MGPAVHSGLWWAARIGSQGTARLRSKAMHKAAPHHLEGKGGGCRPPATHCEPVTLHHFIKLLINLFIFLFGLRGQSKHFIPFRALALPVLLVQRLLRLGRGQDTEGGCRGGRRLGGNRTEGEQNKRRTSNEGFPATGHGTYTIALEQDIQILAAFTVFILHQGALVYRVIAVGLRAVTAVKTFLS